MDVAYKYYLYNLYIMINTYGFKYKFVEPWRYKVFNFWSVDAADFSGSSNPYLTQYSNKQEGLAKDILVHGMFTPFFGGVMYNQINSNAFYVILGKHRYFAMSLYMREHGPINKKFLHIFYPKDIQYFKSDLVNDKLDKPIELYNYILGYCDGNAILKESAATYTDMLRIMDTFGGNLGKEIFKQKTTGHEHFAIPYINNENEFNTLIGSQFNLL